MRYRTVILALMISIAARCLAQLKVEVRNSDIWSDTHTGLTWAGKDNGKDVSWKGAVNYCRDLQLGGQNNWRLAALNELQSIYDQSANAPGLAGPGKGRPDTWHIKGNIFLTGNQWSSNQRYDDRGKPSGYDWWFSFNDGKANNDPSGFFYPHKFMRALCVRDAKIQDR